MGAIVMQTLILIILLLFIFYESEVDMDRMLEQQKNFLCLLKKDGFTFEQLKEAYTKGYLSDEIYKYGLKLYGFKEINYD